MKTLHATETIGRDDWRLVVATTRGSVAAQLHGAVLEAIMAETWALNDAYGTVGFVPPQGWDWSGIRDSSREAIAAMASAARSTLKLHELEVALPPTPPCFRQACPTCNAEPGDLCVDDHMPVFHSEGHEGYGVHEARPIVCQDCGSPELDSMQDLDVQPFNPYCAKCANAEARSQM